VFEMQAILWMHEEIDRDRVFLSMGIKRFF